MSTPHGSTATATRPATSLPTGHRFPAMLPDDRLVLSPAPPGNDRLVRFQAMLPDDWLVLFRAPHGNDRLVLVPAPTAMIGG